MSHDPQQGAGPRPRIDTALDVLPPRPPKAETPRPAGASRPEAP